MKKEELKKKIIEILLEADIMSFEKEFKIANRILKLFPRHKTKRINKSNEN